MKRREEGIIDIMQVKVRCNACFIPDSYYSIFFSSRRRHTRFSRDWSSDVCSSDLWSTTLSEDSISPMISTRPTRLLNGPRENPSFWKVRLTIRKARLTVATVPTKRTAQPTSQRFTARSEERRVGKESRDRRARYE